MEFGIPLDFFFELIAEFPDTLRQALFEKGFITNWRDVFFKTSTKGEKISQPSSWTLKSGDFADRWCACPFGIELEK